MLLFVLTLTSLYASFTSIDDDEAGLMVMYIRNGKHKLLEKLLAEGADPNMPSFYGILPLSMACCHGSLTDTVLLLKHGAMPNIYPGTGCDSCLSRAVADGYYEVVKALLDNGADPNLVDGVTTRTPIFHAIPRKNVRMFKLLVDHGANLFVTDYNGTSLLLYAAEYGAKEIALILLRHGLDPLYSIDGLDCIQRTKKKGYYELADLLDSFVKWRLLQISMVDAESTFASELNSDSISYISSLFF